MTKLELSKSPEYFNKYTGKPVAWKVLNCNDNIDPQQTMTDFVTESNNCGMNVHNFFVRVQDLIDSKHGKPFTYNQR